MTPQQITEAQRLADSMAASIQAGRNPMAVDAIAAMELLRTLAAQAAQERRPAAWFLLCDGVYQQVAQEHAGSIGTIPLYTHPAPAVDVDALMALADDYAIAAIAKQNAEAAKRSTARNALRAALEGLKA